MSLLRVIFKQTIHDKRPVFYVLYSCIYILIAHFAFKETTPTLLASVYLITVIGITNLACLDLLEIEKRLNIQLIVWKIAKKSKSYLHMRNIFYCLAINLVIFTVYTFASIILFNKSVLTLLEMLITIVLVIIIYFLDYYTENLKILTTFTRSLIRNVIIIGLLLIAIQLF